SFLVSPPCSVQVPAVLNLCGLGSLRYLWRPRRGPPSTQPLAPQIGDRPGGVRATNALRQLARSSRCVRCAVGGCRRGRQVFTDRTPTSRRSRWPQVRVGYRWSCPNGRTPDVGVSPRGRSPNGEEGGGERGTPAAAPVVHAGSPA